jgi:hypothetical protein
VAETKAATDGKGANVILDMIAGDYVDRNYDAAAIGGRIVQIAVQGGPKATITVSKIMLKRLTHTGSTCAPAPSPTRPRLRAQSNPRSGRSSRPAASPGHRFDVSRSPRHPKPTPVWKQVSISAKSCLKSPPDPPVTCPKRQGNELGSTVAPCCLADAVSCR